MEWNVTGSLLHFDKETERLVGREPFKGINLPALQRLFHLSADNPMFGSAPVGPAEAASLQPRVATEIDLVRYDYLVECDPVDEPAEAAISPTVVASHR